MKVGDLVQLKTGAPPVMVVNDFNGAKMCICLWWNGEEFKSVAVHPDALIPAANPSAPDPATRPKSEYLQRD